MDDPDNLSSLFSTGFGNMRDISVLHNGKFSPVSNYISLGWSIGFSATATALISSLLKADWFSLPTSHSVLLCCHLLSSIQTFSPLFISLSFSLTFSFCSLSYSFNFSVVGFVACASVFFLWPFSLDRIIMWSSVGGNWNTYFLSSYGFISNCAEANHFLS